MLPIINTKYCQILITDYLTMSYDADMARGTNVVFRQQTKRRIDEELGTLIFNNLHSSGDEKPKNQLR